MTKTKTFIAQKIRSASETLMISDMKHLYSSSETSSESEDNSHADDSTEDELEYVWKES